VAAREQKPVQLPLTLPHQASYERDDFLVGESNRAAIGLVDQWPEWPSKLVILAGPTGSGKTHLTEIWRRRAGAPVIAAAALGAVDPIGLATAGALAIEDADGPSRDDTALFHLLNAAREADASVLITCRDWPRAWGVDLPDLMSRLRAATPVEIGEPDDDLLRRVLMKLFADRQISVDPAVVNYLVVRMERSLAAAALLVDALDREAMSRARAVTRPIAAEVLARQGARTDPSAWSAE